MPPPVAAAAFIALIIGLLWMDRRGDERTSLALWLPIIWMFLGASRMVSQWLQLRIDVTDVYMEGSPVDRAILTGMLVLGIAVLISRRNRVLAIIQQNKLILLFFVYCLVSVLWSDFPLVAYKRWTKAFGNVVMVLIVLTEVNVLAAIKRLLMRAGCTLIFLSVLLIRYYPDLGRIYDRWTGRPFYCGVTGSKNGLGEVCLVFGLALLWRFIELLRDRRSSTRAGPLLACGAALAATFWLFYMAGSVTSLICFVMGGILLLFSTRRSHVRIGSVHGVVAIIICSAIVVWLFPPAFSSIVHLFGRQSDLTGRTEIWNDLFKMKINPLVGTGYESFWLGSRLDYLWSKYSFRPNQAHNGYIDTYINVGWIGVLLLGSQMSLGYRNILNGIKQKSPAAILKLSFLVITAVYNLTEAVWKLMSPVWIVFLLSIFAVPRVAGSRRRSVAVPAARGAVLGRARVAAAPHLGSAF